MDPAHRGLKEEHEHADKQQDADRGERGDKAARGDALLGAVEPENESGGGDEEQRHQPGVDDGVVIEGAFVGEGGEGG